jgi:5-methylcytosine-specific restriction endonuclease McrA
LTLSKAQRAQVFAMFGGHCAYCGIVLPEKGWHADHIEPIWRKTKMVRTDGRHGSHKYVQTGECFAPENDHVGNVWPACRPCNIDKGSLSLTDWRRSLERKVQVLRVNHSAWRHAERFGLVAQISSSVIFHFERIEAAKATELHEPSAGVPK